MPGKLRRPQAREPREKNLAFPDPTNVQMSVPGNAAGRCLNIVQNSCDGAKARGWFVAVSSHFSVDCQSPWAMAVSQPTKSAKQRDGSRASMLNAQDLEFWKWLGGCLCAEEPERRGTSRIRRAVGGPFSILPNLPKFGFVLQNELFVGHAPS